MEFENRASTIHRKAAKAAAGSAVEKALHDSMTANKGNYILVVTGSIPKNEDGIYTMIAGKTA
ncbi:MAG TPA: [Ni/Fe] hydrogenase small subunit, partial [Promineifilum sp.]|nr:[Ni/Fe] hydrogenase small subunit [Promineifilum sp.]